MNQYKLYCINENKGFIVKGFNTTDKSKIKNEVKTYLSNVYPGSKLNESFIITSNPQSYGLNPKDTSSWINLQRESQVHQLTNQIYESITKNNRISSLVGQNVKELKKESIVNHLTNLIYESINEGPLSPLVQKAMGTLPKVNDEALEAFKKIITQACRMSPEYMDLEQIAAEIKRKLDEVIAEEEFDYEEEHGIGSLDRYRDTFDKEDFREGVQRMVSQNINELLTEAYNDSVDEGMFGIRNALRNIGGSITGSGTVPHKVLVAARKIGSAFKNFESAWLKHAKFLGDNPNVPIDPTAYLTSVEAAIKRVPRLKGVKDIRTPQRDELKGQYFASKAGMDYEIKRLSGQQIAALNQTIEGLNSEIENLQSTDQQSKEIIDGLRAAGINMENEIKALNNTKTDQAEVIERLQNDAVDFENKIKQLEQTGAVDKRVINKLWQRLNITKKTLKTRTQERDSANAMVDHLHTVGDWGTM